MAQPTTQALQESQFRSPQRWRNGGCGSNHIGTALVLRSSTELYNMLLHGMKMMEHKKSQVPSITPGPTPRDCIDSIPILCNYPSVPLAKWPPLLLLLTLFPEVIHPPHHNRKCLANLDISSLEEKKTLHQHQTAILRETVLQLREDRQTHRAS